MRRAALFLVAIFVVLAPLPSALAQAYAVTNLFSDGSVPAVSTDPGFQNPWGVSVSGTWWISTANTGFNYVISSTTNASTVHIMVPPGSGTGTGTPAGSVTTNGASGMLLSNNAKASFLFSTLDGTISGWNGTLGLKNSAVALIAINNSSAGASYPGLAILNSSATTSYILAPNFGAGNKVEVYDQTFKPTALSGSFTDPNLPAGYSPWSIHILDGQIWVAYALRASSAPYIPMTGPGNGIVDVFDLKGNFVARAVTGGNLNAPWGIAFAPLTGFGIFSGDLLIGNFGDGKINVYDPKSYAYLGQLVDSTAKPLSYATLWELLPGGTPVLNGTSTGFSGGLTTTVYFTAGLTNEQHGLLGAINNTTVSGAAANFAFSSSSSAQTVPAGTSANVTLAIVPVNNFSGTVSFTCSGLPSNSSCLFSPNTLSVTGSAPATTALSITTEASTTMARFRGHLAPPTLALASVVPLSLLPFALFLRRRRSSSKSLRLFGPLLILILSCSATALILGCGSSSSPPMATPFTPTGHSVVTVTATSGGATQTTTIALTVQ